MAASLPPKIIFSAPCNLLLWLQAWMETIFHYSTHFYLEYLKEQLHYANYLVTCLPILFHDKLHEKLHSVTLSVITMSCNVFFAISVTWSIFEAQYNILCWTCLAMVNYLIMNSQWKQTTSSVLVIFGNLSKLHRPLTIGQACQTEKCLWATLPIHIVIGATSFWFSDMMYYRVILQTENQ